MFAHFYVFCKQFKLFVVPLHIFMPIPAEFCTYLCAKRPLSRAVGQGHVHLKMADNSAPYACNLPILLSSQYLPENGLFHLFLQFGSISRD